MTEHSRRITDYWKKHLKNIYEENLLCFVRIVDSVRNRTENSWTGIVVGCDLLAMVSWLWC